MAPRGLRRRRHRQRGRPVDRVAQQMHAASTTPFVCRSNGLEQLNYRRMLDDARAGLTVEAVAAAHLVSVIALDAGRMGRASRASAAAAQSAGPRLRARRRMAARRSHRHRRARCVFALSRRSAGSVPAARRRAAVLRQWDHMKGIAYLVGAIERLHAKGRRLPLTILGPGVAEATVMAAFSPAVRPSSGSSRASQKTK